MPTELELIALETEFDLYLSFTKRLVLNLPDSDDRTRAAIWLQKLRSIDDDDHKKLRNEHLKLLLFALHRRSLLGVFEKPPHEELESFHDGLTLLEMTRELIELTEKKQASGDNSGESPLPPVTTNVSADLKEYCASQSIPKFGAHVYYAVSNEPIQMWSKSPNCVYPASSDVPNPLQWELTLSKLTDHVLEKQAEAERLAAEAAHDDKTEEKDNTQILPSIDVAVCAGAGNSVFKWKADSILTLHQNYDFSDVGVAEDLEVQGKWQLELDEMAFSILDHSLPGRQKVVVRDPFYQGLPPDIAERRNHGVIDEVEVESSSSSSERESIDEHILEASELLSSETNGLKKSAEKCKCCGKRKSEKILSPKFKNYGPIAKKYLSFNKNLDFGLHFNKDTGEIRVGTYPAEINGDDIVIDFGEGDTVRFRGTEGLWKLLTQNGDKDCTDVDWVDYMKIISRTNEGLVEESNVEEIKPLEISAFSFGGRQLGVSLNPGKVLGLFELSATTARKKLDETLQEFILLLGHGEERKKERVSKAAEVIKCILILIGKPLGWASFVIWALANSQTSLPLLASYLLNDFQDELHIPGTNFCGPGTKTFDRLAQGQTGKHAIDNECIKHDLLYGIHPQGDIERVRADIRIGLFALKRIVSINASIDERFAGIIIVPSISIKVFLEFIIGFAANLMGIDTKQPEKIE